MISSKRTRCTKFIYISLTCLAMVLLIECNLPMQMRVKDIPDNQAADFIGEHMDFYDSHLKLGMAEAGALAYFPRPHNTDTNHIFAWLCGSEDTSKGHPTDWQSLEFTRDGYFMVFDNDKLVTPPTAFSAADPWQTLEACGKTPEQAEQLVGKRVTEPFKTSQW